MGQGHRSKVKITKDFMHISMGCPDTCLIQRCTEVSDVTGLHHFLNFKDKVTDTLNLLGPFYIRKIRFLGPFLIS